MNTLLLTESEIISLIDMREIIEICDKTFKGMDNGTVLNPTKVLLDLGETAKYPPYGGFMNAMPAYIGFTQTAGIKWAGGNVKERKQAGLPYLSALIILMDPSTAIFKAVMDGSHITNMRTGAQTAVALSHILTYRKSLRLGLFGAGMQAHTQTLSISNVFDINEVRVYDISHSAAVKYKEDMKNIIKGDIIICETPQETCDVDVIVCVTQSKQALVMDEWVKPGTIVFPMGSYQEAEDKLIKNADAIVVDHIGQCLHRGALAHAVENGEIGETDITATIGEIASGVKSIGDISNKRIICVPIGTGAMDVAVASIVYERALEHGIGTYYNFL